MNGTPPDGKAENPLEPPNPSTGGRLAETCRRRTRSAQILEATPPTTNRQTAPPLTTRLVYEYGRVAGKDAEYIQQSIHNFNQHPALISKCKELEKNSH